MNAAINTSETNASITANHNCSIKGCSVDHKTLAFFLFPEIEKDDASEDMAYDKEGKAATRVEDQMLNCGSITCRSSSRRSFTFPVLGSEWPNSPVRMVKANRRRQWWKTCICFELYQVSNDIVQLKQLNTPLELYYQKLKGYRDELDALETPYACTCKCDCENRKTNGEREQRKRLIQFLMGLYDSYTNIRGHILLMQPSPLVFKAYGMLKQKEKQRDVPKTSPLSIPTALNTYSNTRNNSIKASPSNTISGQTTPSRRTPFRKGIICTNCQKEGHYGNECYKIVRFPPGHPLHGKFIPSSQMTQQNPKRSVNVVVGNGNAEQELQHNPITSIGLTNNTTDPYVYTKIDQLQNQLNQMLLMMHNQNQKEFTAANLPHMAGKYIFIASFSSGIKEVWITDSGATDNICICLTLMFDLK
nr:cysteine-rich RLK (receptor-like protein kinase) 8 [Tanacetum cinerariifolium]GEY91379.1 cysteine-rich RLK (receptor-like protein kinase) 8 [Tanacetum cinerariifolium]